MSKIIIFVGYFSAPEAMIKECRDYFESKNEDVKYVLVNDVGKYNKDPALKRKVDRCQYYVDLKSEIEASKDSVKDFLGSITGDILAIVPKGETMLDLYSMFVESAPENLSLPSLTAIKNTSEKSSMRKVFREKYPEITFKSKSFDLKTSNSADIISEIEGLSFPVIVKPSGLSTSMYVKRFNSLSDLDGELVQLKEDVLSGYNLKGGRGKAELIIEEFIEGELISVDAYVNSRGEVSFLQPVRTITGVEAGRDNGFYGYVQTVKADLSSEECSLLEQTVDKIVESTELTSSTAHVEVIKTREGEFKAVEIGARIGGYRTTLYKMASSTKHFLNDVLIRCDRQVVIGDFERYCALVKIYPKQKGVLSQVVNLPVVNNESVCSVIQHKHEGEMVSTAENGDTSLVDVIVTADSFSNIYSIARSIDDSIDIVLA